MNRYHCEAGSLVIVEAPARRFHDSEFDHPDDVAIAGCW